MSFYYDYLLGGRENKIMKLPEEISPDGFRAWWKGETLATTRHRRSVLFWMKLMQEDYEKLKEHTDFEVLDSFYQCSQVVETYLNRMRNQPNAPMEFIDRIDSARGAMVEKFPAHALL
jgi:hypothetical protein